MHIFVDTNVLLSFYHFTSDDVGSLHDVFVSHKKKAAKLHLTDQVRSEFLRNREAKISDALGRFKTAVASLQTPAFMHAFPEYAALEKSAKTFRARHAQLLTRANTDISSKKLAADVLIESMFKNTPLLRTTKAIYASAERRAGVGNPPGKSGSLGDAINWELLLKCVPKGEELYVISDDSDFYSQIEKERAHPFLEEEWKRRKKSQLHCYRTLSVFLRDHFAGVKLSLDPEKKALIDALGRSGSFAGTHALVAQLEEFGYFSLLEAKAMLDAAVANNQFGWIVEDEDVRKLVLRAVEPHRKHLKDPDYVRIIAKIDGRPN